MLAYYFNVHAHSRMLQNKVKNRVRISTDERDLLDTVSAGKYELPAMFNNYLSGFRNIVTNDERHVKASFRLLSCVESVDDHQHTHRWFGRENKDTQHLYM